MGRMITFIGSIPVHAIYRSVFDKKIYIKIEYKFLFVWMNNSDCIDVNSSEDGDQCNGHDFVVENYFVETVMKQR